MGFKDADGFDGVFAFAAVVGRFDGLYMASTTMLGGKEESARMILEAYVCFRGVDEA